jgi:Secretion system C-terminal sorting domain
MYLIMHQFTLTKSFLLSLLMLFLFSIQTLAQWVQTNGPYEAAVCSFGASDSFIYAGTIGAGIYRSTDKGETWTPSNGHMTSTYTKCLAVSGNSIYAGSATGEGILLSTDNGSNWKVVNNGLPPNPYGFQTGVIEELAASGRNVFAYVYVPPTAFYLSTDNGSNWISANTGTISGISAIAVIGNNFFVGSKSGVYITTNNGATWIAAGLTDSTITSFAVSGVNLFASTNSSVFLSTNNGTTWTSADSGLPNSGIAKLSANGTSLLAESSAGEYYFSKNNGTSWESLSTNGLLGSFASPLAFASVGKNLFYGYLDGGIYRSIDDGKSWSADNTGLRETSVSALAVMGTTVFVGTNWNDYASSDNGVNWTPSNLYGIGSNCLVVMDSTLFASVRGGIRVSTNRGTSWISPANAGLSLLSILCVAVCPQGISGRNIFVGTQGIAPLGSYPQGGVFLSTDNGANWNAAGLKDTVISAITTSGTNVYAGTDYGTVHVSIDNGSNWAIILSVPYYISAIAVRDGEMFVATWGGGVLRSTNGGSQWKYIDTGLSDSAYYVSTFVVHGANVFAGTEVGVFVLNTNDTSWSAVNTGLSGASNVVYALAAGDTNLYAGLYGGVWRRPLSEMITAVKESKNVFPDRFFLFQNYPNPFNPTTVINYQLPRNTLVLLEVYDVLGRKVKTLVNEPQSAGAHTVTFNAGGLSTGVYFYRLTAGGFVEAKKLMVIK